jgi:RNA polymerase sigma-70 factor (ECF subfamily)
MPTPYSATRLLAELPRLRRYARILTDDRERADALVEETLARARQMQDERIALATPDTRLIALLRAVSAASTVAVAERETAGSVAGADPRPKADRRSGGRSAQSRSDRGAEMLAELRELPLEQREVLVLVAVERLSYAQVADLLEMPVASVISRLSQARAALQARASKPRSTPHTY